MVTMLRRLFWLGVLGGAGYAGWTLWRRRSVTPPAAAPEWPPMPTRAAPASSDAAGAPSGSTEQPASGERRWVDPVDGACPDGFPIKANAKSGIYHVPGGQFYARTVPERCYADADSAEADGYRAAKA